MENFLETDFYNPTRGYLNPAEAIEEVISYIQEKPEKFYELIVGCDSSSGVDPYFPVAFVVLRRGEGGRFFLKKIKYSGSENKKFENWKMRILEEVWISCQMASFLREKFEKRLVTVVGPLNYEFRYIHADIGENGATRDMIREVTGLIRGNGFEPKIKPESYVASTVADRYS